MAATVNFSANSFGLFFFRKSSLYMTFLVYGFNKQFFSHKKS